jgi:hypothetical protein
MTTVADEMGTGAGYQQRYFATRDEAINWCVADSLNLNVCFRG